MANVDSPTGFRPVGQAYRVNKYRIASGYASDLFIGDIVSLSGGNIVKSSVVAPDAWVTAVAAVAGDLVKPTSGNGRYFVCTTAGTTGTAEPPWTTSVGATVADGTVVWTDAGYINAILGAIVGFETDKGMDVGGYFPAGSTDEYFAIVSDAPEQLYIGQDDGSDTMSLSDIGKTGNIVSATAGSVVTNLSGMEANAASFAGAGQLPTDQLTLVDLVADPNNTAGANADWIFAVNNHIFRPVIA